MELLPLVFFGVLILLAFFARGHYTTNFDAEVSHHLQMSAVRIFWTAKEYPNRRTPPWLADPEGWDNACFQAYKKFYDSEALEEVRSVDPQALGSGGPWHVVRDVSGSAALVRYKPRAIDLRRQAAAKWLREQRGRFPS